MTPRSLEASDFAEVNYYRCGTCAHVWTTDKRTNQILSHVTPLSRKPQALLARHRCSVNRLQAVEDAALAGRVRDVIEGVRRTRANTRALMAKTQALQNWQQRLTLPSN